MGNGTLWRVVAPRFVAGLVTVGERVTEAAPILRWTVGRTRAELRAYFARRGWAVSRVSGEDLTVAADLFHADDAPAEAGPARYACTPELLLAWVRELGRAPTLRECQDRYGGILSALVSGWELQRRGEWPGRKR